MIEGFGNRSRVPPAESFIRSVFRNTRDLAEFRGHKFMKHLQRLDDVKAEDGNLLFEYPGQGKDKLYQTIEHSNDDNVEMEELVSRELRDDVSRTRVWYGNFGSGNSLMMSRKDRDALRDKYHLIGLEIEAHGIMNTIPVGNIRGVCTYGRRKNRDWQPYAAAVAAAYTREVLRSIHPLVER